MRINSINRSWIKSLDLNKMDIYPIQFANCDRMQNNDATYIFDEVGSGKTISSGLMVLDFLYNNPNEKALVITANALVKYGYGAPQGQFLKDWFNKLPFEILGLKDSIKIVNNHYSKFRTYEEYGVVIIDEAHLFLNIESLRYENLTINIRAKKVVFLTATPIKSSVDDLYTYVNIAKMLLQNDKLDNSWINGISTVQKDCKDIICSQFNIKFPVTRYFKDTIMSVNIEGFQKTQAKRMLPCLWEYDDVNKKNEKLLEKINEGFDKNNNSRFVIFTRFVDKEAVELGIYLEKNGFLKYCNFSNNEIDYNKKTYYIVTGKNSIQLASFSGIKNLPSILILTYQIAEQGVNLPGFNYVINYHVSSFPSALEQRFGRIDRMGKSGSVFTEINMCYLISKNIWDCNTANFYSAVSIYLRTLISYLPSKNTILTSNIIENYNQKKSFFEEYTEKIKNLCKDIAELNTVITYNKNNNQILEELSKQNSDDIVDINGLGEDGENELLHFCEDRGIVCDLNKDDESVRIQLVKDIKEEILEIKNRFVLNENLSDINFQKIISKIQDKIFYCKNQHLKYNQWDFLTFEQNIGFTDAITECAKNISQLNNYCSYNQKFKEEVKIPLVFKKYLIDANNFFEQKFINNDFNSLFPMSGYEKIFESNPNCFNFEKSDKVIILSNVDDFINVLPIFKMFFMYREILHSLCWCQNNYYRYKYDFNPFTTAVWYLMKNDFGLSKNFINNYFNNYDDKKGYVSNFITLFTITKDSNDYGTASNWYKLAFHYTRKEEFAWISYKNDYERIDHIFMDKENITKYMNKNGQTECYETVVNYEEQKDQLEQIDIKIKSIDTCRSLFHDYIYTKNGKKRKYVNDIWQNLYRYYHVDCNDYWTLGIYEELMSKL